MTLDFATRGKLKIPMDDYIQNMLDEFPVKFNANTKKETPAGNDLLNASTGKEL